MILFDYVFWGMAGTILVLGFAVGLQAINLVRLRDATRRDVQRLFEQMDLTLGELRDVSVSLAGGIAVIDTLRSREASVPSAPVPAAQSYDIALRLARSGAGREELMSTCGMSRHEAELAVRLHGPSRSSARRR
ncbi:MAG: hypothetical protein NAOJABEB_01643 [Steroidobacteraceae bacterium]|nr:hypothetical protein [Steroidobacteraceae bacterium]